MKRVFWNPGSRELSVKFTGSDFREVLSAIKALPVRTFDPGTKLWTMPPTDETIETLARCGFELPASLFEQASEPEEIEPGTEPWRETPLPELRIPEGLELREYQKDGIQFAIHNGGRVLIGDEMGLGKTVQALAYLSAFPEKRPVLIVTTASTKLQWHREFCKWVRTPEGKLERSRVLAGKKPSRLDPNGYTYFINWDILDSWKEELLSIPWSVIVGDEIQAIANPSAKRTKAFRAIAKKAAHFIALSGTPIRSYPSQFFNVLSLLDPVVFDPKSRWSFLQRYCDPQYNGFGWSFKGATNTGELRKLLRPLMIRREKVDVLKELPAKVRVVVPLEVDDLSAYNKAHERARATLAKGGAKIANIKTFDSLKNTAFEAKKHYVIGWIRSYLESGQKLIVFAYHRAVVDFIYEAFRADAVRVYGGVTGSARQEIVDRFQSPNGPSLLVGNIIAAGVGLNLTAASATCFVELGWSPSDHLQAEDRVHRIGQEADSVYAYYLVAAGTVEEEIMELLDDRMTMVREILDGRSASEDDLLTELMSRYRAGGKEELL